MKIKENEIHLWYAYDQDIKDDDLIAEYRGLLSDKESIQQQRFYFEKHRHQYLITRALVRCVLSLYIEAIPPEGWQFKKNQHNKPYIGNLPLPMALNFNLSHTEEMVVLAVTLDKDIGVDVEHLLRTNAGLDIAKRYFSATEFQDLCALPAERQKNRFFELWTLKEAYIKACGMGLAIPLDQFSYSFPEPCELGISFSSQWDDHAENWRLWQIKPDETHIVGMALHAGDTAKHYSITMRKIVPLKSIEEVDYPIIRQSRTCQYTM